MAIRDFPYGQDPQRIGDVNYTPVNPSTEDRQIEMINLLAGLTGGQALRFLPKSTDNNVYYLGLAPVASAEGSAVWKISEVDFTSGVILKWCDGNKNYDNIWTNREALSYS